MEGQLPPPAPLVPTPLLRSKYVYMSDYGVGNNENEAALVQNWYGTDVDFAKYKRDYLKLYKETIEKIVQQEVW